MGTIVSRIFDDEMAAIRSAVDGGRVASHLKALDERGAAAELVRSQYTGRYPFELLQNANDAIASAPPDAKAPRDVRFVLTETALIVANGGAPFGEREVEALCSLSRSSKDPRKTIGYKGLGFKSVGEITTTPQVFSGEHRFAFDPQRVHELLAEAVGHSVESAQRLPTYAFPFAIDLQAAEPDCELVAQCQRDGFVTVLRLPFKDLAHRDRAQSDLESMLDPRLLLLLDATQTLEVWTPNKTWSAYCIGDERGADGDVEGRTLLIETLEGGTRHFEESSVDTQNRPSMIT